ncbi:MAG: hypothetical protein A2X22_02035 [Bacteroidetes bacterium GWF2_49_14]|nr:MAG: hypothetical protein A2X22_02035 [Bacteroidetes bacterium GWF2_49_14]
MDDAQNLLEDFLEWTTPENIALLPVECISCDIYPDRIIHDLDLTTGQYTYSHKQDQLLGTTRVESSLRDEAIIFLQVKLNQAIVWLDKDFVGTKSNLELLLDRVRYRLDLCRNRQIGYMKGVTEFAIAAISFYIKSRFKYKVNAKHPVFKVAGEYIESNPFFNILGSKTLYISAIHNVTQSQDFQLQLSGKVSTISKELIKSFSCNDQDIHRFVLLLGESLITHGFIRSDVNWPNLKRAFDGSELNALLYINWIDLHNDLVNKQSLFYLFYKLSGSGLIRQDYNNNNTLFFNRLRMIFVDQRGNLLENLPQSHKPFRQNYPENQVVANRKTEMKTRKSLRKTKNKDYKEPIDSIIEYLASLPK